MLEKFLLRMKSRSKSDMRIGTIFVIIIIAINFNLFFSQSASPENMLPHIYPVLNLSNNNDFRTDFKIQGKITDSTDAYQVLDNMTSFTNDIVDHVLQTNNSNTQTLSELSYKVNFQNKFGIIFFLDENFFSKIINQLSISDSLNNSDGIYIQNNNLPFINTSNLKISPFGSESQFNFTIIKSVYITDFNAKISILNSDLNQGGVDGFFISSIRSISKFGKSLTSSNNVHFDEYIQLDNQSLSNLLLSYSSTALLNKLTTIFSSDFLNLGIENLYFSGGVFVESSSINQGKSILLDQLNILQLIITAFSVLIIISVLWSTHFRRRFIESSFIRNEYNFYMRFVYYIIESFIVSIVSSIIGYIISFILLMISKLIFNIQTQLDILNYFIYDLVLIFTLTFILFLLFDFQFKKLKNSPSESDVYSSNKFLIVIPIFTIIFSAFQFSIIGSSINFSSYSTSILICLVLFYLGFIVIASLSFFISIISKMLNLYYKNKGTNFILLSKIFTPNIKRQVFVLSVLIVFIFSLLIFNINFLNSGQVATKNLNVPYLYFQDNNSYNQTFFDNLNNNPQIKSIFPEIFAVSDLGTKNNSIFNEATFYGLNTEITNFYSKNILDSWGPNLFFNLRNLTGIILSSSFKSMYPLHSSFTLYYLNKTTNAFESESFKVQGFVDSIFNSQVDNVIILPITTLQTLLNVSNSNYICSYNIEPLNNIVNTYIMLKDNNKNHNLVCTIDLTAYMYLNYGYNIVLDTIFSSFLLIFISFVISSNSYTNMNSYEMKIIAYLSIYKNKKKLYLKTLLIEAISQIRAIITTILLIDIITMSLFSIIYNVNQNKLFSFDQLISNIFLSSLRGTYVLCMIMIIMVLVNEIIKYFYFNSRFNIVSVLKYYE